MTNFDFIFQATNFDKLNVIYQTQQLMTKNDAVLITMNFEEFSLDKDSNARNKNFYFGVTSEKLNIYFRKNEIYVEFNASALWQYGITELLEKLNNIFQKNNILICANKVMRVDFAIDFYYEKDLINALKKKNNIKLLTQKNSETTYKNNFTILYGKSPNNSICIYNKTAENLKSGSSNFKHSTNNFLGDLYRIEYRLGRLLLAENGIFSINTLVDNYFNMLFGLMQKDPIVSTHKKIKKNGESYKSIFNSCRMWSSLIEQIKNSTQQNIEKLTKMKYEISPEKKAENVKKYLTRVFNEFRMDMEATDLIEQAIFNALNNRLYEGFII